MAVAALLLASCAGTPPGPPSGVSADAAWTRAMKDGRAAFERGDLGPAARFYEAALSRGRTLDDAPAIADAAYNLAACRVARGEYESARALLATARAEMSRGGTVTGDVLLVEARVAWALGEPGEALSLTGRLLALPENESAEGLRIQARLLRGEIACAKGDAERAAAELALAGSSGGESVPPAVNAARAGLEGCISLRKGKTAQAASRFDREAEYLRDAGQYRNMAGALRRAGDAYRLAPDAGKAADRWFRASRTIFTLGDLGAARDLATKAQGAAADANDDALRERARSLLEEIAAEDAGG